jgi:hypothetical protein
MQYLRRLYARLIAWRSARPTPDMTAVKFMLAMPAQLGREVSSQGVRFYSLCASCGGRLTASATLCDECAQRRARRSGAVGEGW